MPPVCRELGHEALDLGPVVQQQLAVVEGLHASELVCSRRDQIGDLVQQLAARRRREASPIPCS